MSSKGSANKLPTSRAIRLSERLAAKESSKRKILAQIGDVDMPAEYWKDKYAEARALTHLLGDRIALWSRLVAQAAGIDSHRTPSDEETEAVLVGWATQAALAVDALDPHRGQMGAWKDRLRESEEWRGGIGPVEEKT